MEKIADKLLWHSAKIIAIGTAVLGVGILVYFVFIYNPEDSPLEKRLKKMNTQIEQLQKEIDELKSERPKNGNTPNGISD